MKEQLSSIQPWFSYHGPYKKETQFYYDPSDFDWVKNLEANYLTIKAEMEAFISNNKNTLDPYFNVDLIQGKNTWKVGTFYFWGKRNGINCDQVPKLEKILSQIPGFVSAGLSILEPNTQIKEHHGDTDASVRGHLPFVVPSPLPNCGLQVGKNPKSWEEGKVLLFNDAQRHKAWNNTNERRYLLIFDVIKPENLSNQNDICANANSLIALQQLEYKYPIVKKFPGKLRGIIRRRLKRVI